MKQQNPLPIKSESQTAFVEDQTEKTVKLTQQFDKRAEKIETPFQSGKKIFLFMFIGIAGGLIFIAILVHNFSRQPIPIIATPTPTPEATVVENSEIEKTLQQIHQNIKDADPAINDFPFPPISFDLPIERKK